MRTTSRNRRLHVRPLGLLVAAVSLLAVALATPAGAASQVHKVALTMTEFRFEPATIHLRVGEQVVLTIRNKGAAEHEWSAGRGVVNTQDEKGYHQDLFALLKPNVTGREYELEKVSTRRNAKEAAEGEQYTKTLSTEVDVEPGGMATLQFTVPAAAKGEWQMGCFIPGHYESGMKGSLVVE